jgi:hypothetical protein
VVLYVVWVGSPPSNEPTTLPFLVVRNACRVAPQSTHQVSWRDYNDSDDKESPRSYAKSTDAQAKSPGFAGFMTNQAGSPRAVMYTRCEIGTVRGLNLTHAAISAGHLYGRAGAYRGQEARRVRRTSFACLHGNGNLVRAWRASSEANWQATKLT